MLSKSSFRGEEDFTGCKICSERDYEDEPLQVTLVDKVARGGWGQVYLGQLTNGEGGYVAVKVITNGSAITPSRVNQVLARLFEAEASCLVALTENDSPGVVRLLGTGMVQKYGTPRHFLMLEWMACGDAQQLMERFGSALDIEAAGTVLLPVLRALRSAHDLGYMHRDVKASNILLGPMGEVVLGDWGICGKLSSDSGRNSTDALLFSAATSSQADTESASSSQPAAPRLGAGGSGPEVPGSDASSPELGPCPVALPSKRAASCCNPTFNDAGHRVGMLMSASSLATENLKTASTGKLGSETPPVVFAPGAPMGTQFWAAPELDVGLPHNESVDVWSVGITFVELITGVPPYYDTSPDGLSRLAEPATGFVPAGLPEEVMKWLAPCLSVQPADRPSVTHLLQQPFFLRLAALEYLQAAAAEAAEAAAESGQEGACGEAASVPAQNLPAWHKLAMGGTNRHSQGDSSEEWDGLPPLTPLPAGSQAHASSLDWRHQPDVDLLPSGISADGADNLLPAGCGGGGGMYAHLDPEMVLEMMKLQMIPPGDTAREETL